ncbi:MAG TPA: glycosyltransferase family 39 protein [Anaerolineales bacterium]|nr:glycosyltransferase family 39 protein [Anaerolineales bacterium]
MNDSTTFFSPRYLTLILILLFGLGFGIRLYELTNPPLDFHPTRQLLSAIKARGMYYQGRSDLPAAQRQFAVQEWKSKAEIEPEIVEHLAAFIYRFTGEQIWIGRIDSSLFWIIGGIFLFLLLHDLVSLDGALLGTAFYLFLPWGVIASRSFQPDPLMVLFIILFWWALNRFMRMVEPRSGEVKEKKESLHSFFLRGETVWAILAGLFGGLAIFIKFSAAFFVLGGGLGMLLGRLKIQDALRRPQIWIMVMLGALPGAAYLIYGTVFAGFLGQQFDGRFIPSLLVGPALYINWITTLNHVLGGAALALALLGIFFFRERAARSFVIGLWAAYLLYGLYFDYHIWSHDYYNLPLVPLAAVSLAALGDWFMTRLAEATSSSRWMRILAASILTFGLFAVIMDARATLKSVDYRPQVQMWSEIGQKLGPDARVVSLTEDYGSSLAYWGWLDSTAWPLIGDINYHSGLRGAQNDFEGRFKSLAAKRDFFLVTTPDELNAQPLLKARLEQYPIFAQGAGYIIYDLRSS